MLQGAWFPGACIFLSFLFDNNDIKGLGYKISFTIGHHTHIVKRNNGQLTKECTVM